MKDMNMNSENEIKKTVEDTPMQSANITSTGEVLYLDADALEAKVDSSRPLRVNQSDGIGFKNWLVHRMSVMLANDKKGGLHEKAFQSILKLAAAPENSAQNKVLNRVMGTDEKGYSHVHVIPLNVDLTDKHSTVIVPYDLMIAEIKDADCIAIMNYCVCRMALDCKDYPHDFGCIFTGFAARHVIDLGIAREATVEEAIAHVDKAAELGLMGAADYIEAEQFVWDMKNSEMNDCRMLCFCCECCCIAMNALKVSTRDINNHYTPVGWTAVVDQSKCVGCRLCASHCPRKCISFKEVHEGSRKVVRVTDNTACLGCGFCKKACKFGAISIKQTMPMRKNLQEYFLNEARIDDGRQHAPAVHIER